MTELKGKVAIITGGASGMGRAASILFAERGANVVVADLNVKGGEEVAAEASASGNRCVFQRTDVSKEEDVKALVARAVSEFGGLDIMFNNAGIGGAVGPLEEISVEDWDKTQAVCLRGVFLGIKHAVGAMRARGGGAIVNTASIAGVWGYPMLHAYSAREGGRGEPDALGIARVRGRRHPRELHRARRRGDADRGRVRREQGSGGSGARPRPAGAARRPARRHRAGRSVFRGPACRLRHRPHAWWWTAARWRDRQGPIADPAIRAAPATRCNASGSRGRASSRGDCLPYKYMVD